MQGLARSGQIDGGDELQVKPGLSEMKRQRPVIVSVRFEPDWNREAVAGQHRTQALEVFLRIYDRYAATTLLARNLDQPLVAVLGNVDGDQDGRSDRMGGGNTRCPQRCVECKTTFET